MMGLRRMLRRDPLDASSGRRDWMLEGSLLFGGQTIQSVRLRDRDGSIAIVVVDPFLDGAAMVDCCVGREGRGVCSDSRWMCGSSRLERW